MENFIFCAVYVHSRCLKTEKLINIFIFNRQNFLVQNVVSSGYGTTSYQVLNSVREGEMHSSTPPGKN